MGEKGPAKGQGGRPRKPLATHIAEGTFDKYRHAERNDLSPDGLPSDLLDLDTFGPYGAALFKDLTSELERHGLVGRLDSATLSALCYWWNEFATLANGKPLAGDRAEASRQIRKREAFNQFAKLAGKYGLDPQSRASLSSTKPTVETNPFEEYLKRSRGLE